MKISLKISSYKPGTHNGYYCWVAEDKKNIGYGNTKEEAIKEFKKFKKYN